MIGSFLLMVVGAVITSRSGTAPEEILSKNDQELLLQEVRYIASNAVIFWRKPAQIGGGKKSFKGLSDVSSFGVEPITVQRVHEISFVQKDSFVLTSTSLMTGVKIISTISNKGIVATPKIIVPPDQ